MALSISTSTRMYPPYLFCQCLCFTLLSCILVACDDHRLTELETELIHQDIERAERIAKETSAAAAEAETAANLLHDHQHTVLSFPAYQVYSQAEYDQKIHLFKQEINVSLKKLSDLKDTQLQQELCNKMKPMFRQLDEVIYYNPEYANPTSKLEQHLNFFQSSHQIWSERCQHRNP